jgi:hypothetical protein
MHASTLRLVNNTDPEGEKRMKHFRVSFIVTAVCLLGSAWWGYTHAGMAGALAALAIVAILAVMEV